jgi:hypothetical protein
METFDPHKSTTEVRGASPRRANFRVLLISIVLIVAAFVVIWAVYTMWPSGNVIS